MTDVLTYINPQSNLSNLSYNFWALVIISDHWQTFILYCNIWDTCITYVTRCSTGNTLMSGWSFESNKYFTMYVVQKSHFRVFTRKSIKKILFSKSRTIASIIVVMNRRRWKVNHFRTRSCCDNVFIITKALSVPTKHCFKRYFRNSKEMLHNFLKILKYCFLNTVHVYNDAWWHNKLLSVSKG